MRALIIEPSVSCITLVRYNSREFNDITKVIEKLAGSSCEYEYEFPNGDGLFLPSGSIYDNTNYAFGLKSVDLNFFGRAVVTRMKATPEFSLVNCHFTMETLRKELIFYGATATAMIRKRELDWEE